MIDDARAVPKGTTLRTGVCIIGGGAAGITIARALSSRHDVVLLESGGLEPRSATQDLYDGRSRGLPYDIRGTRLRYLGGSTNHWSGWCRPLDTSDFEARDWVPHSGWPFGRSELDPYYARAHEVCDLGPFEYEIETWQARLPRAIPLLQTETLTTAVFRIGPTLRFGEHYRRALRTAGNVRVLLHANGVNIALDGSRVTGVDVATLTGVRFRVDASVVILATGGIENARLLLSSRDDRRTGIGNEHDLVGRFFIDHPHVLDAGRVALSQRATNVALHTFRYVTPSLALDARPDGSGASQWVIGTLALTPDAARERRIPRFSASFNLVDEPSRADRDVLEHLDEVDPVGPDERPIDPVPVSERILRLELRSEAFPNPASRVRLATARDALGMPRADLRWALTTEDWAALHDAPTILGQELARLGLGRTRPRRVDRAELEGGAHHIGTTRMHVDPKHGVVDANCQVHGVSGLYVAGSSVFPTAGFANPTLTIVALAIRLADHLEQVA